MFGNIFKYRTLSIVGLAKNAGKTECLNYILGWMAAAGKTVGVTSIGTDGENLDQVTSTHKPEIWLRAGSLFTTAERYYLRRQIHSEILDVGDRRTALGRFITAKALTDGKVILSGPGDTVSMSRLVGQMQTFGADHILVDGALSRMSPASPAVTEAMILVTGAAVAGSIAEVVKKTRFVYDTAMLGRYAGLLPDGASSEGITVVDKSGKVMESGLTSAFAANAEVNAGRLKGMTVIVGGALTDKLLSALTSTAPDEGVHLVVKDFTRIFAAPLTFYNFIGRGGVIEVIDKAELVGICTNPVSPDGRNFDAVRLFEAVSEAVEVPVCDVRLM